MTWTHNICLECWTLRNPNQIPAMIKNAKTENCCFCGQENKDGICIRHDPKELNCKHEDD